MLSCGTNRLSLECEFLAHFGEEAKYEVYRVIATKSWMKAPKYWVKATQCWVTVTKNWMKATKYCMKRSKPLSTG